MYYLGHEQKRTNVKEDNSEKYFKNFDRAELYAFDLQPACW